MAFLLLTAHHWAACQNLVPNPSFEEMVKEPCRAIQVDENLSDYLVGWRTPTLGTADVWSGDSSARESCPRVNTFTYNFRPRSGLYCIGLFTYGLHFKPRPSREYARVRLSQPLVPGKVYYTELYALVYPGRTQTSNNLGLYFSTDSTYLPEEFPNTGNLLAHQPQVNAANVLDKPGWQHVSGCFVATQPYQYLTIGNFLGDQQTIFKGPTAPGTGTGAYYVIDDVYVGEAGTSRLPPIPAFNADTILCADRRLSLVFPDSTGVRYRWQDGTVSPTYTIRKGGVYMVTASAGRCSRTDTLRVRAEVSVKLPPDTVLCRGETLTLTARHPSGRYRWNDGSQDSTLAITETGTYTVQIPTRSCVVVDTVRVSFLDCPGVVPNVITPNGDGKNDAFVIENVELLPWKLRIYNRWGTTVFQTENYQNDWQAEGHPSGTYYYSLTNGQLKRELKGWIEVLR